METRMKKRKIKDSVNPIKINPDEKILKQMKSSICKIINKNIGTGFFCNINLDDKKVHCLLTNYHILDEEYVKKNKTIKISMNDNSINKEIPINENDILYFSKSYKYDIIIIKINIEENYINYLELDDNLFNKNFEKAFSEQMIYILHYPNESKSSVSFDFGAVYIEKFNISHKCDTKMSSSGGPILNFSNKKVIGIHREYNDSEKYNIGTILKGPLKILKNKINKNRPFVPKIEIETLNEEVVPNFPITFNLDKLEKDFQGICIILGKVIGSGFFCKISYKNSIIPVLITNYHIIDDNFLETNNEIKLFINFKKYVIKIDEYRKIYSNLEIEYDIMIIKLKPEDNINNYLEIDEKIFTNNIEYFNKNNYVYMFYFSNFSKPKVSFANEFGKSSKFDIKYICDSELNLSGSPILDYNSHKVIGIHKRSIRNMVKNGKNINIGTFLKFPFDKIKEENEKKQNKFSL